MREALPWKAMGRYGCGRSCGGLSRNASLGASGEADNFWKKGLFLLEENYYNG